MRKIDLIHSDIYNSIDQNNKGISVRFVEQFFVEKNQELYLILITENSNFNGDIISYEYSIYSITKRKYIEKSSTVYAQMSSSFPILSDIQQGGQMSFLEKRRLTNLFNDLVEEIYDNPKVNEDIWTQYYNYLEDTSKLKSESMQKVYTYFKEERPNGTI